MSAPVFATTTDLARYVPAGALATVAPEVQERALLDASAEALNYIPDQAKTPLTPPHDPALVRHVCWMAMWQILSFRGMNVEAGSNDLFRINNEKALAWLTKVARREITLTTAGTPVPGRGSARVLSAPQRGWERMRIR